MIGRNLTHLGMVSLILEITTERKNWIERQNGAMTHE